MRIARFGLAGAILFGVIGCQTEDGGAVSPTLPPLAFVRYINAVPDSISLDSLRIVPRPVPLVGVDTTFFSTTHTTTVRWIDQLEFSPMTFVNVAFRGVGQGGYQALEAGSRQFKVFTYDRNLAGGSLGGFTTQLADTAYNFAAGQYYTIVHVRGGAGQPVRIYADTLPAASTTQIAYRMVHVASSTGAVDFYATAAAASPIAGAPFAANVPELGRTAYASVAPAAVASQFTATGLTTSLAGAAAPTGVVGTTAADPISGATVAGSVLTAFAFRASPAIIWNGRTIRAALTPAVAWVADRSPTRTTTP